MSSGGQGQAGSSSNRVIRGGNFNNNANNLRAANRNNNTPTNHNNNIGLRCAKTGESPREDAPKLLGHGPVACGDPQSSLARLARDPRGRAHNALTETVSAPRWPSRRCRHRPVEQAAGRGLLTLTPPLLRAAPR